MIQFKQECYAAYIDIDDRQSQLFGYFTNESDALDLTKGKGWYGGDGRARKEVINIKIYESQDDYHYSTIINEREAALSKLTEREKQILGL